MSFHTLLNQWMPPASRRKDTSYWLVLTGPALETIRTITYLGANILDDMNWGTHVHATANKANKTLCFLQHNLKISDKKTKGNYVYSCCLADPQVCSCSFGPICWKWGQHDWEGLTQSSKIGFDPAPPNILCHFIFLKENCSMLLQT